MSKFSLKIMKKPTLKSLLRSLAIVVVVLAVVLVIIKVKAGDSLDPPGPPTPGTMKTLGQLYCKLTNTDCPGDVPSLDPTAAPGTTMHTIKEVYDYAPEKSEMNAGAGDVTCGKDFFGTGGTETGAGCVDICKECSAGSCGYIADGYEDNYNDFGYAGVCEAICKKCDGEGSCVNVANFQEDTFGENTCLNSNNEMCDGSGNCISSIMYVFITSDSYTGGLGGLSGADAKCQTLADNAGLPGTYKAWLSIDSSHEARDRISHIAMDYILTDGITVIANGWDDLIDGELDHAIDLDENGIKRTDCQVWTATDEYGAITDTGHTCSDWYSSSSAYNGDYGKSNYSSYRWTRYTYDYCNKGPGRLYCFRVN